MKKVLRILTDAIGQYMSKGDKQWVVVHSENPDVVWNMAASNYGDAEDGWVRLGRRPATILDDHWKQCWAAPSINGLDGSDKWDEHAEYLPLADYIKRLGGQL